MPGVLQAEVGDGTTTTTQVTVSAALPPTELKRLDALWLSVGSRAPLLPETDAPFVREEPIPADGYKDTYTPPADSDAPGDAPAFPFGLRPSFDGEPLDDGHPFTGTDFEALKAQLMNDPKFAGTNIDGVGYADEYGVLNAQRIYQYSGQSAVDTFTPDSTKQVQYLAGATYGAIADASTLPGANPKHIVGVRNSSVQTRGGAVTYPGVTDILGVEHVGVAALQNPGEAEGNHNGADAWKYRRWFVHEVTNIVSAAMIGREVSTSTDDDGEKAVAADWMTAECTANGSFAGANARFVTGSSNEAYIDNKVFAADISPQAGRYDLDRFLPVTGGYINTAWGVRVDLINYIVKCWLSIGSGRGVVAALNLTDDSGRLPRAAAAAADQRSGSSIGAWTGIQVRHPVVDPARVGVNTTVGLIAQPQVRWSGFPTIGVRLTQVPPTVEVTTNDSPSAVFAIGRTEDHPGYATAGEFSAVIGDGTANPDTTGYDTDAMHVAGVLKFDGLSCPPDVSLLPVWDRAGVIFYRVENVPSGSDTYCSGLWISVPAATGTDIEWIHILTTTDSVADCKQTQTAADTCGTTLRGMDGESVARADLTRTPRMTVEGSAALTFSFEGFGNHPVELYTRAHPITGGKTPFTAHGELIRIPDNQVVWETGTSPLRSIATIQGVQGRGAPSGESAGVLREYIARDGVDGREAHVFFLER